MEAQARSAIEMEIARMMVVYCRGFDGQKYDDVVALFTEDATWQRPGATLLQGLEAIKGFVLSTPAHLVMRHLASNILVTVIDEDHATASTSFTLFVGERQADRPAILTGPALVGDYHDRLIRTNVSWKISHRETEYLFAPQA